ncbi:MAG: RNA polymerase sigma factor [Isosphaeraceae bacterium]
MTVEPASPAPAHHECLGREVSAIVEEEVGRLPRDQQVAVIRCLLEGRTHESAARELGWPLGTVKSRIAAARQTLTRRLARRGLTPSGIAAIPRIGEPSSRISAHLVRLTAQAAARSLANPSPLAATMPASVAGLVRGVARLMLIARIRAAALLAVTLTSLAWAAPALLGARPGGSAGQTPARPDTPAPAVKPPRTDRYGDPLPPGAVMRLGSVRFRHDRIVNHIAYTPDGRLLVTDDRGRFFQTWDAETGLKIRRIDSGPRTPIRIPSSRSRSSTRGRRSSPAAGIRPSASGTSPRDDRRKCSATTAARG